MSVTLIEQVMAGKAPGLLPLTVDQFHRMIDTGILRDGEPVELIDGVLVRKDCRAVGESTMAHSPRHALVVSRLQRLNPRIEPHVCHVRYQLPVTLSDVQEPEPDAAVVRGELEAYAVHHPEPTEIIAAIEVAESSLEYDRRTKQRIYATAGIPLYWIVNLPESQIEVYEMPVPAEGRYARRTDYRPGQSVRLRLSPTVEIDVAVSEVLL
ncbi:MAG: Uma2 family endonuclease [Planctomycetes bacterium]|nr:Uma2 family endonuclease [Planctomycetota bacterium]